MEGFVCEKLSEDKRGSRCETSDLGVNWSSHAVSMNNLYLELRLFINPSIKKYSNLQLLIHMLQEIT